MLIGNMSLFKSAFTSVDQRPSLFRSCAADGEQWLSIFHGLPVADEPLHQFAFEIAFDLVHQLHGFDNAQDLPDADLIAGFNERRRPRRGRLVKSPDNRRADDVEPSVFVDGRGSCRFGSSSRRRWTRRRSRSRSNWYRRNRHIVRCRSLRLRAALDPHLDVAPLEFELGDVLLDQEFYEFFDLFLVHRSAGVPATGRPFMSYSSISALGEGVRMSQPPSRTTTMSSMRTPPRPGT